MDEKKLIIKFHKGVTYEVPARIIAEDRAKYYADLDGYDLDSNEYFNEVNRALEDEFIIFEWVQNNMNWWGLEPYAIWIENESFNLEDEWNNGNHTISVNW